MQHGKRAGEKGQAASLALVLASEAVAPSHLGQGNDPARGQSDDAHSAKMPLWGKKKDTSPKKPKKGKKVCRAGWLLGTV